MAARSVHVVLVNKTSNTLQSESAGLTGGIWSSFPPTPILAFSQGALWESESNGFLTGTEGSASYHLVFVKPGEDLVLIDVPDLRHLALAWNNPFVGDNTYSQAVGKAGFQVHRAGGGGDNATVVFTLRHASQDNWRWCHKCQGLVFRGQPRARRVSRRRRARHAGSGNYYS